jgi:hypothetical protein
MPTFSIDNDRVAANTQDVAYDQTAGAQTQATTDKGDEVNVILTSGELDGLDAGFETFLTSLALSTAKDFAVLADAASSSNTFITVTADPGETLNGLALQADSNTALANLKTLTGGSIYVHVAPSGNYATLWTTSDNSGRIVGAVALTNETVDNVTTHTATAGVQMVFFEAIKHTNTSSQDETIALGDVLKVAVDTAVSFNFTQLAAGNFLWAAVGDGGSAMLITGRDMNVRDTGPAAAVGNKETGGSDGTDTVNTSKATDTTIGINAQHFAPGNSSDGATGVFTFVTGYAPLELASPVYTGDNVKQIDYDNFINVSSASVFISQLTGGTSAKIHFSLWEAGGGEGTADVDGADHLTSALVPEEGYTGVNSYIGNQDNDTHLKDDTAVNVAKVEIDGFTWNYNDATNGTVQGTIKVTITGNDIVVEGATANDLIKLTAVNVAGDPLDGTFNRIDIQAMNGSASFDIGHVDLSSGGLTSADLGSHLFVDDDGPALTPQAAGSGTPNNLQVDNNLADAADSTDFSSYGLVPGTDGQQSYTIVNPADGTHTADTTGTYRWAYTDGTFTSIAGTVRVGTVDQPLYTLVLNPATGRYDFTMTGAIPGSNLDLDVNDIKAGGPNSNSIVVGALDDPRSIEIGATGGPINESNDNVGVTNGNFDTGEALTFKLFDGTTLQSFQGISIGTKSASGGSYGWTAHVVGTPSGDSITGPDEVTVKNGTILISPSDLGGATIDSITITKEGGGTVKIGLDDISLILLPADVQLGFTVQLADGDNDTTAQSFVVDIDADNDGDWESNVSALSLPLQDSSAFMSSMTLTADHDNLIGL